MKTRLFLLSVCVMPFLFACQPKPAPASKTTADTTAVAKTPEYSKMIIAKVFIKPGKENEFIRQARIMIDSTHKEAGNESYQLYQDPYEKTNFVFVETYKNQAAVEAHFASSYFKKFGPLTKDLVAKDSEVKIYDIAGTQAK